jgi:serine/threonine protein kinase/Flp pilus assembly protein TadD
MNTPSPLEAIVLAALGKGSPRERAAYLDGACAGDEDLRRRVEQVLAARAPTAGFPEPPPRGLPSTVDERPAGEGPGAAIGPYRLLEQIGEGGFGAVFLAEQSAPVRRKVALKVLKPGMDTRQVVARFEQERQALAIMDHPNIAKVFDGGATPAGRPYFVMELVRGVPITDFCDQNRLTPRQRLGLFADVCRAVQHAHQKGIIHRDLKPSNVLVSRHDTTPVVKVIDFGVAKALGRELTDKTLFTGTAQMVGTPLYMSPEQAGVSDLDVDTRSDIYSLGVLLYELLTGTTPFPRGRFSRAGYDEICRIIREEEPPRPSTRLRTTQELASVAASRGLEPRKLSGLVRGELDWIVMRCLEKDRNRRYETAAGLARDVERYLADEPVAAGPPSAWYRFRKFARRHRGAVAAVCAILVLVIGGILGTTAGLVRALRAERHTAEQRQRAQENLRLALKGLDAIYLQVAEERLPRDSRRQKEDTEILRKALDFYEQFARQNADEPPARLEVSRAYRRAGDIQQFVGEHAVAQQAYGQALATARTLAAEFPGEAEFSYELALCCARRAEALAAAGQLPGAADRFGEAIGLLTELSAQDPAAADYRAELARGRHGLGKLLRRKGERGAAEEQFRQALELQEKLAAEFPAVPRYRFDLAETHQTAGSVIDALNVYTSPEDVEHMRRARRLLSQLVAEFPEAPLYRYRLAITLQRLATFAGQFAPRIENYQQAVGLFSKLAADFPQVPDYRAELGTCYGNFGTVYSMMGDWDRAGNCFRQSLELYRKLAEEFPTQTRYRESLAVALSNWSEVCLRRGELAEARKALQEALALERGFLRDYPDSSRHAAITLGDEYTLAGTAEALGDGEEAAKLRRDADQLFEKTWKRLRAAQGPAGAGNFCADIARGLQETGDTWGKAGNERERAALYAAAVKSYGQAVELNPDHAEAYFRRGGLYAQLGRHEEAAADFSRVIELDPKGPGAWFNDPKEALSRRNRANAYLNLRQYERAIADLERVRQAAPENAQAHNNLARVLATCPDGRWRDPARAVELARRAVGLAEKSGPYWTTLGVAQYRAGDWGAAVEALRKAVELRRGGDGTDWLFLAMAHWQLGKKDEARQWYDKAVQWMEKNQASDEIQGFRAEADALLGGKKKD